MFNGKIIKNRRHALTQPNKLILILYAGVFLFLQKTFGEESDYLMDIKQTGMVAFMTSFLILIYWFSIL
jgi:hypothetical protein